MISASFIISLLCLVDEEAVELDEEEPHDEVEETAAIMIELIMLSISLDWLGWCRP
jgi:hypothetical protein